MRISLYLSLLISAVIGSEICESHEIFNNHENPPKGIKGLSSCICEYNVELDTLFLIKSDYQLIKKNNPITCEKVVLKPITCEEFSIKPDSSKLNMAFENDSVYFNLDRLEVGNNQRHYTWRIVRDSISCSYENVNVVD